MKEKFLILPHHLTLAKQMRAADYSEQRKTHEILFFKVR